MVLTRKDMAWPHTWPMVWDRVFPYLFFYDAKRRGAVGTIGKDYVHIRNAILTRRIRHERRIRSQRPPSGS